MPWGMAAQLTATKGPALRGPLSWNARATPSVPVQREAEPRRAGDLLEQPLHGRAPDEALPRHHPAPLERPHIRAGHEERVPHADDALRLARRLGGRGLPIHDGAILAA